MPKQELGVLDIAKSTIKKRKLGQKSDFFVLMVSGGSDSVALAYIFKELYESNFAIVHLDHKLRDTSSIDANFVEGLAKHLGVRCFSYAKDISRIAADANKNIEACGREARYNCAEDAISQIVEITKIKKHKILIATAHTADDRIENFYMRSIVGTGPGGLSSMKYKNENRIRPLLDITKAQLVDYLNNLDNAYTDNDGNRWREDETNHKSDRFRSYVRNNIVPLAKRQNPKMVDNLVRSMNLIADENEYFEKIINENLEKYFEFNDCSFKISPKFTNAEEVIQKRCIYNALLKIYAKDTRIESRSITSILQACSKSNYTDNIQQNYSVHSNKQGVLVQPMNEYRKSRNRI